MSIVLRARKENKLIVRVVYERLQERGILVLIPVESCSNG